MPVKKKKQGSGKIYSKTSASPRRNSTSKTKSAQARKQNRNSDGTFAPGFSHSKTKSAQARKQNRNSDGTFAPGSKKSNSSRKRTSNKSGTKKSVKHTSPKNKVRYVKHGRKTGPMLKTKKLGNKLTPAMRFAETKFKFECSEFTKKKVLEVVTQNFSLDEIERIDRQGKLIVKNDETKDDAYYQRKTSYHQDYDVAISLKHDSSDSTITHELIHHLRSVDERRDNYSKNAYPVDNKGVVKEKMIAEKNYSDYVSNAEETATTAETELRTKHTTGLSKYWRLYENDIKAAQNRDDDREMLRSKGDIQEGENIVGVDSIEIINKFYPKTFISSRVVKD